MALAAISNGLPPRSRLFDIAKLRARRAAMTEILERGRYLNAEDAERIAAIKRRRPL